MRANRLRHANHLRPDDRFATTDRLPRTNPATLVPLNPSSVIAAPTLPVVPPNAAPVGPLISFGQSANPVQVGPGLFGQPKAYVPGQGLRNWLRYFTP